MRFHVLAKLLGAQVAIFLPLADDPGLTAVGFDLSAVFRVEYLLPGHVKFFAEIAHVENALFKTAAYRFGHAPVNRVAVGNRRLAAFLGRRHAAKPDFHGPFARIGLLVVQRDVLMRGIFGGGIHYGARHGSARCRTEFVLE